MVWWAALLFAISLMLAQRFEAYSFCTLTHPKVCTYVTPLPYHCSMTSRAGRNLEPRVGVSLRAPFTYSESGRGGVLFDHRNEIFDAAVDYHTREHLEWIPIDRHGRCRRPMA
jgi:hypothetical protein